LTVASAPGKVILFGEHAVVSGIPALGAAIDLRVRVRLTDLAGRTEVQVSGLSLKEFSVDISSGQVISTEALRAIRYVSAVLKKYEACNLRLAIESELPPSSGLGSSASVVVATTAALNEHLGLGLSMKEIASDAHAIEKEVQQGLGSPMDTSLATFGGYLQVDREARLLDIPQMVLVVGSTEMAHDTRSEVQKVQSLRKQYPVAVDAIFDAIGSISQMAVALIREHRLHELGDLMNMNHGLLEALGVCTRELSELIYAARSPGGALGAKLTGAGGGGCMIALPPEEGCRAILTAIAQAKGRAFTVRTGSEGVRLES
jgi:mevalonate kinase